MRSLPLEATSGGVEVLRGGVAYSELDRMGHMNVRYHVARGVDGLVGLAAALGMPGAYSPRAFASLRPTRHLIRFLKEARADAVLHMRAGIVEMGEADMTAGQILFHSADGAPATTFTTRLAHVTREGRPFAWSADALERVEALAVEMPRSAQPRSTTLSEPCAADGALADAMGLPLVGLTSVSPADCDVFGRMRPEGVIDRIALSVSSLHLGVRQAFAESGEPPFEAGRLGGAMVEFRCAYRDWPVAGQRVAVRAGLAMFDGRARRMVYWLIDPDTGLSWASAEAVSLSFDLETRKALVLPAGVVEAMQTHVVKGLTL